MFVLEIIYVAGRTWVLESGNSEEYFIWLVGIMLVLEDCISREYSGKWGS